jgi:5'-nucleotidase
MAVASCKPMPYEGRPVTPDPAVQLIVDEALAKAGARRSEKLGVTLSGKVTKSYGEESIEGNWFCDLMLAAQPTANVSVTNGGGLRADIPAGELTYGQLFEAMPFDNRFAVVDLKGAHLRKLVTSNLQRGGAILSWGGLAAKAKCNGNKLDVAITVAGKPLSDNASYKLVTSDFLASGGDGLIGRLKLADGAVKLTDVIIRDAMAEVLRKKKGTVDTAKIAATKRLDYPGKRPVQCGKQTSTTPDKEPTE